MHKIMSLDREHNHFYYEVKPGDTLWAISRKFGVPVDKLMTYNNIKTTSLHNIRRIIVFKDIVLHEIEPTDTLQDLAEEYNTSLEDIMSFNGITCLPDVGEYIIVKF